MASFEKKENAEEKTGFSGSLVMYLHDLCWMLAVVMILFLVFFRIIVVSGPSMKMTLLDGDYLLLINNLFYREPEKGDVVVVSKQEYDNGKPIVKRVIATEGQIVDMDFANGIVYVDGLPLEEDYINTPTNLDEGSVFPQIVEENHVFVMGRWQRDRILLRCRRAAISCWGITGTIPKTAAAWKSARLTKEKYWERWRC